MDTLATTAFFNRIGQKCTIAGLEMQVRLPLGCAWRNGPAAGNAIFDLCAPW